MDTAIYVAHIAAVVAALIVSFRASRTALDPYFVFVVVLSVLLMSDFMVRGYALETTEGVSSENLEFVQCLLILFFASAILSVSLVRTTLGSRRVITHVPPLTLKRNAASWIIAIGWLIVLAELLKRLYFSDWSLSMAIDFTLGPRRETPWVGRAGALGNLGDEKSLFALPTLLFPLSGLLFAYVLASGRRMSMAAIGWLLSLAILVADGSRTPVALQLIGTGVFVAVAPIRRPSKMILGWILVGLLALTTSAMILYRDEGIGQLIEGSDEQYSLTYHQDDNYRGTLAAIDRAWTTSERWDGPQFFLTIAVNPVPRFFWAEKPALLEEFWGNYKDAWTTIGYVGEAVAIFGVFGGFLFAILFSVLMYLLLWRASRELSRPGGVVLYIVVALYVYMTFRSIMNLTIFMYLPLGALAFFYIANRTRSNPRSRHMGIRSGEADKASSRSRRLDQ